MAAFEYRKPIDVAALKIEAECVRLEIISPAFERDIFETFDADVTRYMFPQPAKDITETSAFVDSSLKRLADNLQFVILDKNAREFLGCCGLHGEASPHNPELGIWLKTAAHGHGYGREAITALVTWAKDHLVLNSFSYPVDKRNHASRKIPLALGGEPVDERVDTGLAGNKLELVFYRIPV